MFIRAIKSDELKMGLIIVKCSESSFGQSEVTFANARAMVLAGCCPYEELLVLIKEKGLISQIEDHRSSFNESEVGKVH